MQNKDLRDNSEKPAYTESGIHNLKCNSSKQKMGEEKPSFIN